MYQYTARIIPNTVESPLDFVDYHRDNFNKYAQYMDETSPMRHYGKIAKMMISNGGMVNTETKIYKDKMNIDSILEKANENMAGSNYKTTLVVKGKPSEEYRKIAEQNVESLVNDPTMNMDFSQYGGTDGEIDYYANRDTYNVDYAKANPYVDEGDDVYRELSDNSLGASNIGDAGSDSDHTDYEEDYDSEFHMTAGAYSKFGVTITSPVNWDELLEMTKEKHKQRSSESDKDYKKRSNAFAKVIYHGLPGHLLKENKLVITDGVMDKKLSTLLRLNPKLSSMLAIKKSIKRRIKDNSKNFKSKRLAERRELLKEYLLNENLTDRQKDEFLRKYIISKVEEGAEGDLMNTIKKLMKDNPDFTPGDKTLRDLVAIDNVRKDKKKQAKEEELKWGIIKNNPEIVKTLTDRIKGERVGNATKGKIDDASLVNGMLELPLSDFVKISDESDAKSRKLSGKVMTADELYDMAANLAGRKKILSGETVTGFSSDTKGRNIFSDNIVKLNEIRDNINKKYPVAAKIIEQYKSGEPEDINPLLKISNEDKAKIINEYTRYVDKAYKRLRTYRTAKQTKQEYLSLDEAGRAEKRDELDKEVRKNLRDVVFSVEADILALNKGKKPHFLKTDEVFEGDRLKLMKELDPIGAYSTIESVGKNMAPLLNQFRAEFTKASKKNPDLQYKSEAKTTEISEQNKAFKEHIIEKTEDYLPSLIDNQKFFNRMRSEDEYGTLNSKYLPEVDKILKSSNVKRVVRVLKNVENFGDTEDVGLTTEDMDKFEKKLTRLDEIRASYVKDINTMAASKVDALRKDVDISEFAINLVKGANPGKGDVIDGLVNTIAHGFDFDKVVKAVEEYKELGKNVGYSIFVLKHEFGIPENIYDTDRVKEILRDPAKYLFDKPSWTTPIIYQKIKDFQEMVRVGRINEKIKADMAKDAEAKRLLAESEKAKAKSAKKKATKSAKVVITPVVSAPTVDPDFVTVDPLILHAEEIKAAEGSPLPEGDDAPGDDKLNLFTGEGLKKTKAKAKPKPKPKAKGRPRKIK